jgi:quercetin dioxygenase-like cupin family protein
MQAWDVMSMDVTPHQPEVLTSTDEGRAIVIHLPAGDDLADHEVHERAWVMVARGRVHARDGAGGTTEAIGGTLLTFAPQERRELRALEDSQILMLLTPWPAADRVTG